MDEALAPYRPLAMRTAYTPLDARLTAADANSLIGRIRPRILCAPASRASASPDASRWQQGSRESVDHCIIDAACWFWSISSWRDPPAERRGGGSDAPAVAAAQPDRGPSDIRDAPPTNHRKRATRRSAHAYGRNLTAATEHAVTFTQVTTTAASLSEPVRTLAQAFNDLLLSANMLCFLVDVCTV